jgi:acetyl-CoA carboxylase biotin carboxyl carrier protein
MSAEPQENREEPMPETALAGEHPVPDAPAAERPAPAGEPARAEPVAVGPGGDGPAGAALPAPGPTGTDASLLSLVDRLAAVLERSDLGELEVAAGGTTIILRAPSAVERPPIAAATDAAATATGPASGSAATQTAATAGSAGAASAPATRPSVKAPLTGLWYGAPSPGATPYVRVGDHVSVGQIVGLIEAMKLFNEIKSDLAGRVVRVCVDNGALVKAKQPVIEVEPG